MSVDLMPSRKTFKDFYSKCDVKTFCLMFENELPQTIAFCLSFCNKNSFIVKVLKNFKFNDDVTATIVTLLKNCENIGYDKEILDGIELYCNQRLEQYEKKRGTCRKNHTLPYIIEKEKK